MTREDLRVKRLIAMQKRGGKVSIADVIRVCPYRSLIAPHGVRLTPDTMPSALVAVLGFTPEDFSPEMRADILDALRHGEVVGLMSNRADLRDYAKREIALAISPGAGTA